MSLAICLLYTVVALIEAFGVICIFMVTISFLTLPAKADRVTAPSHPDARIYLSRICVRIVRSSRGCHSCRDVLWFCSMSFFTSGILIQRLINLQEEVLSECASLAMRGQLHIRSTFVRCPDCRGHVFLTFTPAARKALAHQTPFSQECLQAYVPTIHVPHDIISFFPSISMPRCLVTRVLLPGRLSFPLHPPPNGTLPLPRLHLLSPSHRSHA